MYSAHPIDSVKTVYYCVSTWELYLVLRSLYCVTESEEALLISRRTVADGDLLLNGGIGLCKQLSKIS